MLRKKLKNWVCLQKPKNQKLKRIKSKILAHIQSQQYIKTPKLKKPKNLNKLRKQNQIF